MKLIKKLISSQDFWPFIIVILFGIFAGRILLTPGYFNMHDDLQMMRQLEMEKCFRDFQIPCRWVPDMGYGFGFPLFNFYPPLPYLVGQGIRLLGFSFVDTAKLTFFLSFVLSGVTMYLLAKNFWGRLGGVLSAVFYIWAPYHSVDVFVRGAMNEAWALVWFPLILWSSHGLIACNSQGPAAGFPPRKPTRGPLLGARDSRPPRVTLRTWIVILALTWAALLTSHNLMAIIFLPVFAFWCLFWMIREKQLNKIPQFIISGIIGFSLVAFFSIPVFMEQKLVHIDSLTVGYYEYIAHFANIHQLFTSRFWGYGASVWADDDGMPFPIGHIHWVLALVILALVILSLIWKRKSLKEHAFIILSFIAIGFFAAFMAHSKSTPIWKAIPILSIVQFPWRFLTIVVFSFSFVAGALVSFLNNKKLAGALSIALMIGVVLFNLDYFKPERMGPLTDKEKFSAAAWELQQTAGIYDYLPRGAKMAPQGPRKALADIVSGKGEISDPVEGTNWAKFKVNAEEENTKVRLNIFKFPNWKVFVDGKEIETSISDDEIGRMHFTVGRGDHKIEARLFNTFPRILGNTISLFAWVLLLTFPWWRKRIASGKI